MLDLTGQAAPTRETVVDIVAGPKKSCPLTKSSTTHEPSEKESPVCIPADSVGQLLPVPVSAADSGKLPDAQQGPLLPGMEIQTLTSAPSKEQPVPESLRLKDFDVTRFEYKIETEPVQTDVPFRQSLELQAELMQRNSLTVREFKPTKSSPDIDVLARDTTSPQQTPGAPASIGKSDGVQKIQLVLNRRRRRQQCERYRWISAMPIRRSASSFKTETEI